MEFYVSPMTAESVKRYRAAGVRLPRNLSPGRAPTRRELADVLRSVDGLQAKSSPSQPATGRIWRIDLRPQSRPRIRSLAGEHATIIVSPCPKPDEALDPVVVQDGTPIAAVSLAFALASAIGPVVLEGGEFYGKHPIWAGGEPAKVLRDIAACLENCISEEEYTNQDELYAQLDRLHAFGGQSKEVSPRRGQASPEPKQSKQTAGPISLESPEWLAVLSEVLRDPSDDTPRLAAADWLAENGHHDRAEFIRAQVELDRMVIPNRCQKAVKQFQASCGSVKCQPCSESLLAASRRDNLLMRCNRLLGIASNQQAWCGFPLPSRSCQIRFARGFVDVIMLQVADFLSHAAAMFRAEPIAHVGLTYVSPHQHIVHPTVGRPHVAEVWFRDSNSQVTRRLKHTSRLPAPLFDRLPGAEGQDQLEYAEGEAAGALNRACVAFGRELAGLPAWEPPSGRRIGEP